MCLAYAVCPHRHPSDTRTLPTPLHVPRRSVAEVRSTSRHRARAAQKAAELAALTPSLMSEPFPFRVAYLRISRMHSVYAESAGSPGE